MADEEAKILADARKLSLADRVEHKNWKVRSEAYEDIKRSCDSAFSNDDPILEQAGPLLAKCVGDTNANAMDRGLEALSAWLQKADESQASRIVSGVCSIIASKCLKARAATVAKATDACLLFTELEQSGPMVESVLKALSDKVPKVVLAALDVLLRAVSEFGAKVVDPKPLFKALPPAFTHSNAGVRDKAKELTVELAAGLGPAVVQSTLLEKMSDAMKKDVESSIAALPSKRKQPERLTRREAAARAAQGGASQGDAGDDDDALDGSGGPEPMDMDELEDGADAYDFSDPVDILGPLGKCSVVVGDDSTPFWDCFESKKWNVRKGALDKVKEMARAPRLAVGDYGELCRELKKVLGKDANINCAAAAAEVTGALANGLRRDFASQARQLCSAVMERFKEKNTSMSKAADEALRAMAMYCYTLPDVVDDLVAAMAHKNPKVRLDTLRLVGDMVDNADKQHVSKVKDPLISGIVKLAPDADATIREAAQAALVACALKLGSFSAIKPFMSKLDEPRCKIIEDAVTTAAKQGGSRPGANTTAAAPAGRSSRPTSGKAAAPETAKTASSRVPSARGSPQALAPKNANVASTRPAAAAKPAPRSRPGAVAPAAQASDDGDATASLGRLTVDEAEQHLSDEFGASTIEELRSPQWQARLEAITAIADKATESAAEADTAVLIMCLAHIPGWSEKNFQVLNKVFEVVTTLARECPGVGKREAAVAIEGAADKVHELKHRLQACEVLTAMSESVGPRFVAAQLHTRAAANKNPKVLSEALAWLAQAVDDFGLASLDLSSMLQWMVADLGSPNAPVRNQAMAVLGRCHVQVGGGLMAQLAESLKPAQVTALEEIFRKNPQDREYQPSRKLRARAGKAAHAGAVARGGRGGAAASIPGGAAEDEDMEESAAASLEDLLPRADVSGQLTSSLIERIGSANWKERNAALEEVETILKEAGGRIKPDLPSELFPALRGRMADTNRNLAARALLLIGKLADAVGPPFDRIARPVLVPALSTLSDNKKQVRDAAIAMLDSWLGTCPAERLFPAVADAAGNAKGNIDGRVAALSWMTRAVEDDKAAKCVDTALRAIAVAVADKSAAVRDAGGQLLTELVQAVSGDEVSKALGALDSATRKAVEPMVQKAISAAGNASGRSKAAGSGASEKVSAPPPAAAAAASSARSTSGTRAGGGVPSRAPPPALTTDDGPLPILSMGTGKAARAKQFRFRPGKFEAPSIDELDTLEAALAPVASDEFRSLLFSREFKDHVKAADALIAAIPSLLPEITASLDLILRWAVVRVCEANTQALVRVLEALKALLEELASTGYRFLDSEATALLPAIVEKAGHNQDRVRGLHRDVLCMACSVYPPPRVVDFLTQGLASKNSRTKLECCEEIAAVVEREGAAPVVACKSKPMTALASLLKERDGALRAAALAVIEEVWAEEGAETVWKLLGQLDTREKGMVEDRLRRSTKQTKDTANAADTRGREAAAAASVVTPKLRPGAFDPGAVPVPASNGGHSSNDGDGVAMEYSRPAFTPPNALDMTPLAERPRSAAFAAAEEATPGGYLPPHTTAAVPSAIATPVPQPMPTTPSLPSQFAVDIPLIGPDDAGFEQRWNDNLAGMASPCLPDAINATKMLCADVMLVADPKTVPPASRKIRTVMGASAERLFLTVLGQMEAIFVAAQAEAAAGTVPSSRGCKFALNALLQGMSVHEVASGLPQATLRETVSLLLCRLVDERGLMLFDEGPTLVRAVNVLIAKLLEASDRNLAFAALLQLLREPPLGLDTTLVPKFNDLVVKCLIKLTKGLATGTVPVDLSRLLFNLHDFFMFLGVDEIRKRSSDDKPLRMVKTILHEVCKVAGHGVYDAAAGIPGRDSDPPAIIFTYIQLNLSTLEQSGKLPAASEVTAYSHSTNPVGGAYQAEEGASAAAAADVQAQAAKAEVKQRLKEIMTQLVSKDAGHQEAAMVELYRLKKEQPQYVERYIAKTSTMFRQFIDTGLAKLEASGGPGLAGTPGARPGLSSLPRLSMPQGGTDIPSPGGSARSDSSASRLSTLRERLSHIRASTEGGGGGGGGGTPGGNSATAAPGVVANISSSAAVNFNDPLSASKTGIPSGHPSVEELTARLQVLRRAQQ